jgi:hypothetical protein
MLFSFSYSPSGRLDSLPSSVLPTEHIYLSNRALRVSDAIGFISEDEKMLSVVK